MPKTATGWILIPQAATLSHLDGSTVGKWCRIAADIMIQEKRRQDGRLLFRCEKVQGFDGRWRWHIERASFMAWVRLRRVRAC